MEWASEKIFFGRNNFTEHLFDKNFLDVTRPNEHLFDNIYASPTEHLFIRGSPTGIL